MAVLDVAVIFVEDYMSHLKLAVANIRIVDVMMEVVESAELAEEEQIHRK